MLRCSGTRRASVRSPSSYPPIARDPPRWSCRATLRLLDATASIDGAAIDVDGGQLGDGYGIPTAAMFDAVRLMARTEGLLLDPVYGGKAFAGLLADIRRGALQAGDAVLFLMTGGGPGLFAYQSAFEAVNRR